MIEDQNANYRCTDNGASKKEEALFASRGGFWFIQERRLNCGEWSMPNVGKRIYIARSEWRTINHGEQIENGDIKVDKVGKDATLHEGMGRENRRAAMCWTLEIYMEKV